MICPKCGFEQQEGIECQRCGIVFAKYRPAGPVESCKSWTEANEAIDSTDRWINRSGKLALTGLMAFFFFYMVIKRSSWCFLDYVNLPFHEAGHIMFRPFGDTVQFLGGTIGQLMWPFILVLYFALRKEWMSASFCLFWFGENFLNISKYIADARAMNLPLVGGGIHDWNYLLSKWNILDLYSAIAHVVFAAGVLIMTGAMIWTLLAAPRKTGDENI